MIPYITSTATGIGRKLLKCVGVVALTKLIELKFNLIQPNLCPIFTKMPLIPFGR